MTTSSDRRQAVDVVVIGAGFAGLYALHRLKRSGLQVTCFEAGEGVGGAWYWNRYPGARVDFESMQYSYSFDDDLQQDWVWPELFSPQEDLERYLNHVADRFGLRPMIQFGARVDHIAFDEDVEKWRVSTEAGHQVTAKYVVAACGPTNVANVPPFPGLDTFEGTSVHTARWPEGGVEYAGKRVGVIGTGASGVQVIPEVAKTADHLYVFQRTPVYSVPANNRPLQPDHERDWKDNYAERRAVARRNPYAMVLPVRQHGSVLAHTPEQRAEILDAAWQQRSGLALMFLFDDVLTDAGANEVLAEWLRGKIREVVADPETAEMLCPKTYPVGTKRLCVDNGYYETFNRENVTLVDVRDSPIVAITREGVQTEARHHPVDVLILATGFHGLTGSLTRMNVNGRGGVVLADKWKAGPVNYLGMVISGFPNLFVVNGPGSPSVLTQMVAHSEYQVDWISALIEDMERRVISSVDTTSDAETQRWEQLTAVAGQTLFPQADSWYTGANIEGKPRNFMLWAGGFDTYIDMCDGVAAEGYTGLVLDENSREKAN